MNPVFAGRARVLVERRRVPAGRRALQRRARAPGRPVADRLLMGPTMLGVAGWPVAHSRSPAMFAPALAELGLDWRSVRLPLPPERFAETARALAAYGYPGINA